MHSIFKHPFSFLRIRAFIKILIVSVASILFLQTGNPANEVMVTAFLIVLPCQTRDIVFKTQKVFVRYLLLISHFNLYLYTFIPYYRRKKTAFSRFNLSPCHAYCSQSDGNQTSSCYLLVTCYLLTLLGTQCKIKFTYQSHCVNTKS